MGFIDWVKEARAEAAASPHLSQRGNPITSQWRGSWLPDADRQFEYRRHVGKSAEGFHGGLEMVYQGSERAFQWSNARQTVDAAEKASQRIHEGHEHGFGPPQKTQRLFAEWWQDYAMARERHETGKEPERGPLIEPSAPEPTPQKAPVRRERGKGYDISF
jgi:cation diffusion facilitator CzcD-associated flavoprotein CzcO